MSENNKSPFRFIQIAALGLGAAALGYGALQTHRKNKRDKATLQRYNMEFDKRLDAYEKSEFQPLDADALKQENIFEDLTVDTQAADYARDQFMQQQANIMQGMRGMAGSSGIAGFAQSLSAQASQQAKQTQLSIGQQLQQNRRLQLQEESRLRNQERQIQLANMEGARQFELDKMSTLIGISGQKVAGAQQAIAGNQAAMSQIIGGVGQLAGAAVQADWSSTNDLMSTAITAAAAGSDRKIKKNIKYVFNSPSGLPVYNFEYIDAKHGSGVYQGVMSDEVSKEAVIMHPEGYEMVDYSMLDVEFKKLS